MRDVEVLPALETNYIYLFEWKEGVVFCVDPSSSQEVEEGLKGRSLSHILLTHHHWDHIGGVQELKEHWGARVIAPRDDRFSSVDQWVEGGDEVRFDTLSLQVIATPGHTSTHVSFYSPQMGVAFVGDTLFLAGCGRLFEGSAAEMWSSFKKLRALPNETLLYCGHEYTQSNLAFALTLDPSDEAVRERLHQCRHVPTVPGTLGEEKRTNPFMRVEERAFQKKIGMEGKKAEEVFHSIRKRKDRS